MIERRELHFFSDCLQRDMTVLIHGHAGVPFIFFPCQDSMHGNFEEFGMVETISDYLESGKICVFSVDTVDRESWSDKPGDPDKRIEIQEQYFRYVTTELIPWMYEVFHIKAKPFAMGFSLGATHAAIDYFRRPDLFGGMLALAGVLDAYPSFGYSTNPLVYENSPISFLSNLPDDHPYHELYAQGRIIISVGQGRWNEGGIRDIRRIRKIFDEKGIAGWTDLWGYDVDHDWPWWKKQIRYFLPFLLGEKPFPEVFGVCG